ncbi:penicillin-binding protein 2 [Thiohalocapsa marina]|uniref:Penicillin-binding protein 2 n=1 Tax=Thiohalocapsa marina TaxID=424902 RepID=A0A5M8FSV0_9GAMM|nr:penicillin-binding transpeptidase domain-containing protein [Thiohalocapsa marina]KAA6186052.1 penicillin-binding protein 2 [Thiohalocapsa marina]
MELLNALFVSAPWATLRGGLHIAFLLVALYVLKQVYDLRAALGLRHLARPRAGFRFAVAGVALLFLAVLGYQASWQLSGTARPAFVAFMQLHDRRQFNPAHWIERGSILDHRGEVLAESRAGPTTDGQRLEVRRVYPHGPACAHVLGYTHPRFGTSGMEAAANVSLNGGSPETLLDWGELTRQLVTRDKRARGHDLVLNLDADLQQLAYERLRGRAGAVVMLRPADGAVRVLASSPSFDPNRVDAGLFRGTDPDARLLNRAVDGLYPPGSVFKVVLAAAALDAGLDPVLDCPAEGFTTSRRYPRIRDHDYYAARRAGRTWGGHGRIGLDRALIDSSNVYFAQLGVQLGHEAFHRAGDRFLFNHRIALTEGLSRSQFMRTARIEPIATSDRYGLAQAAIGQGKVLVTPAQMALIAAAVANDGVAMRPRLTTGEPAATLGRFMSDATARRLSGMMRRVVSEGTGRGIDTPELAIAGKTGTAQNPFGASHSWFIGFAPASSGQAAAGLAVAVLVEQGGYGSTTAAPIARDLLLRAQQRGLLP